MVNDISANNSKQVFMQMSFIVVTAKSYWPLSNDIHVLAMDFKESYDGV